MQLKIVSFKVRKKINSSYQAYKAIADKLYFYFVISTLLNSNLIRPISGDRSAQDMSRWCSVHATTLAELYTYDPKTMLFLSWRKKVKWEFTSFTYRLLPFQTIAQTSVKINLKSAEFSDRSFVSSHLMKMYDVQEFI